MDSEPSDQQILRDYLRTRDERLLRVLMERHLPLVYAVALRISGSPELSAETAQDVFLKLTRTPAALMKEGIPLIAWLHRTARHRALDLVLSEKSRKAREQAVAVPDIVSEPSLLSPEVLGLLDEVIEKLPPLDRDLVLQRYFLGRSLAAIGGQKSLTEDAVRMRLKRSLEKMRTLLQSRGVTTTTALLTSSLPLHALSTPPTGVAASVMKAVSAAAGTTPKISLSLLTFLMTTTQKSILAGSLLICAGILTVAIQSHSAAKQEDGQKTIPGATAAPDGGISDRVASKNPGRPKTAPGQEYADLIQKYGESRTKLAIHVARNTALLASDTAVIDQSPTFAKEQHESRQFLLNQLGERLGLRDDQKDQLLQMLPDLDRKETDWTASRAKIVTENPTAIAETNLALDLWSQDKMSETEVREVLAKASEKLGGENLDVLETLGVYETKTSDDPLEHFPEMTRQLEATLDASQLQKYRECQGKAPGSDSRPIQKRSLEDADIGMERSMKGTALWADDVRAGRK